MRNGRLHFLTRSFFLCLAFASGPGCALIDGLSGDGEDVDEAYDAGTPDDFPKLCITTENSCTVGAAEQLVLVAGQTSTVSVDVTAFEDVGPEVKLAIRNNMGPLPPGFQVRFDPPTVAPGNRVKMYVTTASAARGLYLFDIVQEGRAFEHFRPIVLLVAGPGELAGRGAYTQTNFALAPDGSALLASDCVRFESYTSAPMKRRLVLVDPATLRIVRTLPNEYAMNGPNFSGSDCPVVAFVGRTAVLLGGEILQRVALSDGRTTNLATDLGGNIQRIAVTSNGASALLLVRPERASASRLVRVDLVTGAMVVMISELPDAVDFALERNEQSIIVVSGQGASTFARVRVEGGQTTILRTSSNSAQSFILEANGTHVITESLTRLELRSGGTEERFLEFGYGASQVTLGVIGALPSGEFLLHASMEHADGTPLRGRLERVVAVEPRSTFFRGPGDPHTLALTAQHALVGLTGEIQKIALSNGAKTSLPLSGSPYVQRLVPHGETHVIGAVSGLPGALFRVDLSSGQSTELAVGVSSSDFVALDTGALLLPDAAQNRLVAFDMTSGAVQTLATGFASYAEPKMGMPSTIAASSGAVFLGGYGPLHRVDLTTRAVTNLGVGPTGERLEILPDDRVFSADGHGWFILDLRSGTRTRLRPPPGTRDLAVAPGGTELIGVIYGDGNEFSLVRLPLPPR